MVQTLLDKYEFTTVSPAAIGGMAFALIISVALPIVAMIVWKKKSGAKISTFFIGCLTFIASALIVEGIFNRLVFAAAGAVLTENIWLYAIYGGLAAGIFEEVGRFIFIKYFMKNDLLNKKNGIMHGIGHGGVEAIILVGLQEISLIANAVLINAGAFKSLMEETASVLTEQQLEQTIAQTAGLWKSPAYLFYIAGIERISAIALHIALSYFVYRAVKEKKFTKLFAAIGCHALFDFAAVTINNTGNVILTEIALFVMSVVMLAYAAVEYKKEQDDVNPFENLVINREEENAGN